jgi:rubrerythrin
MGPGQTCSNGVIMDKMKEIFYQIYVGESKAALRLEAYARKAAEEGYSQISRLFRVISLSEEIHGLRAFKLLEGKKSTEENLADCFQSETSIAAVAYRDFQKNALAEGKEKEALIFSQAHDVVEAHSRLYKNAMEDMLDNREVTYYVCNVCGYIAEDHLPETCPVCHAKKENFFQFPEPG